MAKINKILLVNAEYPPISGGGGVYTYNLARGIATLRPEIQVVVLAGTADMSSVSLEENPLPNLKVIRSRELYLIDQGMTHLWKVISVINETISHYRPDIVHTHHVYESLAASICKQSNLFKLIITIQKSPTLSFDDYKNDSLWNLIGFIYKQAAYDGIIVNSQAYLGMVKFLGAKKSINLSYYGIDKDNFYNSDRLRKLYRNKIGVDDDCFLILCPSRIDERKGIDILVGAILRIKKLHPNFYQKLKVIIAGAKITQSSEGYFSFLNRLVQSYSLSDKIMLGFEDGAYGKMNGLYNAADLVVIPSLREGLGFSAIEAMKVKKPVLVSNTIGLKEIVVNTKNGFSFKVGDSDQLAKEICHCFNNKERLNEIALKGWNYQKNKFTIAQMAKEHLDFYQSLKT